jgi:hypothetical protein
LENKIKGKKKKYKSTPIKELIQRKKYKTIEKTLKEDIDISQQNTSDILDKQKIIQNKIVPQDISKWIINTILDEKLQYRKIQERSDKWKIINGILAVILPILTPIITNLMQYYLTNECLQSSNGTIS